MVMNSIKETNEKSNKVKKSMDGKIKVERDDTQRKAGGMKT